MSCSSSKKIVSQGKDQSRLYWVPYTVATLRHVRQLRLASIGLSMETISKNSYNRTRKMNPTNLV